MKLKDLKIGTQLRIGMGAILVFVALLGVTAWFQAESLWQETKGLYEHPLTVRRTIDTLTTDILSMHRDMKDLVMAENERERQSAIQGIAARETEAFKQFDTLYDRYLGPRSDIDDVRNAFVQWKSIRDETIRLLRAGKITEAVRRTKSGGVGGVHVEKLLGHVQEIMDFARKRGEQFYAGAQKHKDDLMMQQGMVLGAILLLTLGISYILLKGIRDPLRELTWTAEQFRQGKLEARSGYDSANEFGTLIAAFNTLADTVQSEWRSKESAARIAKVMLQEEDLRSFCRALIKELLTETGSQIGAIYLLNEHKTAFDHFESIGLAAEGRTSFSAAGLEGEFGAALVTQHIQYLTDIPEDTRFTFASVGGDFQPREIITIPIPGDGGIVAVISLAGVRRYPAKAVRLVNEIWNVLTARWNGVLAFRKISVLTEQLKQQNQELQVQQEELEAQAEELRKQTEELQGQNVELDQQRLAVEEASRLKSQFLSNMSHELRTPLNSVMALSRVLMMQAGTKLSAEEVNYLEIIERNGRNLLTLINDILDLSKIEAGRMDVHPKPFSLRLALEDILESIGPLAAEKQIELRQEIPGDLPPLESDEIRVSQILQNLIGNAVKFTDAGGVTVSVESDHERFSVRVADTGIGIAEKDLPYIFDEFRQVDGTSARRYEGTGLGLAIARKAARMLGGEIAVTSAPGQGSLFTLTLPVHWQGKAAFCEPVVIRQPSAVKPTRKTILVVDDEPEMAALISRYLLQEGYNTVTATSGSEALILAARERPFAITLDIIMPDMDGWEVLQGLKKNLETKEIPVIIVSISEDRETGFALGAIGYVTKPVSKKRLVSEIAKIGKPSQYQGPERRTSPPRILVVEDNEAAIIQIKAVLESAGYAADVARGGQEAFDYVFHTIPDGIVLDLMMPEIDGFHVLEKIRGTKATAKIPVLILTAKDLTPEDFKKLSANHIQQLVQKGDVDREILLSKVGSMLGIPKPQARFADRPDGTTTSYRNLKRRRGDVKPDASPDAITPTIEHIECHAGPRIESGAGFDPASSPLDSRFHGNDGLGTYSDQRNLSSGTPQTTAKAVGTPAVLIVEDNPDNMTTIKAVLQDRYRILEATDGEEGLRMAVEARPDLILLDMALPKMDGFTVVRHLKGNVKLSSIPVLALTARVMKGDRERILDAGCDDYIAKPIDPEGFLNKIGEWLKE